MIEYTYEDHGVKTYGLYYPKICIVKHTETLDIMATAYAATTILNKPVFSIHDLKEINPALKSNLSSGHINNYIREGWLSRIDKRTNKNGPNKYTLTKGAKLWIQEHITITST